MKVKNIDLFKIADLINQLNPEADVSSINFYGSDISISSSFSFSDYRNTQYEDSLKGLSDLLKNYEER